MSATRPRPTPRRPPPPATACRSAPTRVSPIEKASAGGARSTQVFQDCVYQIGRLGAGTAKAVGIPLRYVTGALQHGLPRRRLRPARRRRRGAVRPGPDGPCPTRIGGPREGRVPFVAEGFADRRHLPTAPWCCVRDRTLSLKTPTRPCGRRNGCCEKGVQTLCVHGGQPEAAGLRQYASPRAGKAGMEVRPFVVRTPRKDPRTTGCWSWRSWALHHREPEPPGLPGCRAFRHPPADGLTCKPRRADNDVVRVRTVRQCRPANNYVKLKPFSFREYQATRCSRRRQRGRKV